MRQHEAWIRTHMAALWGVDLESVCQSLFSNTSFAAKLGHGLKNGPSCAVSWAHSQPPKRDQLRLKAFPID